MNNPELKVPFRATWFAWVALAYLFLALYGSLVPFRYHPLSWEDAFKRWHDIPWLQLGIGSRSDFVANILLFIPLAYLLMATFCVDRDPRLALPCFAVIVVLLALLSVAIEFTQIFFPPRTVSLNDIAAESAGGVIGASLWLAAGMRITHWTRGVWIHWRGRGLAVRLLPGYLAFLVIIHLMPFDLTISPVEVYHKYRDGKIILVPFTTSFDTPFNFFQKNFWNLMYFLPAGLFIYHLRGPLGHELAARRVLGMGVLLAAGIECLQLTVFTRYFDTTDILTGSCAVWLGWALAKGASEQRFSLSWLARCWLPLWLLLAVLLNWAPFDFAFDADLANRRLSRVSRIPFADYYWGTEYNAFLQVLDKALLFAPLGGMLVYFGRLRRASVVIVIGLSLALVLEAGQLFLPGRYPSVTDILVETLGTWLGFFAIHRMLQPAPLAARPRFANAYTL